VGPVDGVLRRQQFEGKGDLVKRGEEGDETEVGRSNEINGRCA